MQTKENIEISHKTAKLNNTKTACALNLGCKVSKYEIDCIASILQNDGYHIIHELAPADVYVVNTCAVTNESEKKSRQFIERINKQNPNAKIIVMGCASQNNIDQFIGKQNVFSVVGCAGKEDVLQLINAQTTECPSIPKVYEKLEDPLTARTRAYIKVQDGCNNFCSYCIIPYVRGRSRSRELADVVKEVNRLSAKIKEIVITGIDLSSFKVNEQLALPLLMESIKHANCFIRLSSLEVNVITEELLSVLKTMPNFRQQFHLSLQSGSDTVLKRMNRHYTSAEFLQKVALIKKHFPEANITTDVIVGFPEETEEEFNETIETCLKAQFGGMHIFPFSKRNGTVAARLKPLNGTIVKRRVKKLEVIKETLCANFITANLNKTHEVVLEQEEEVNGTAYMVGFTGNYIKAYINKNAKIKSGDVVSVKITQHFAAGAKGELI